MRWRNMSLGELALGWHQKRVKDRRYPPILDCMYITATARSNYLPAISTLSQAFAFYTDSETIKYMVQNTSNKAIFWNLCCEP